jgi:hypothetical protein
MPQHFLAKTALDWSIFDGAIRTRLPRRTVPYAGARQMLNSVRMMTASAERSLTALPDPAAG